MKGLSADYPGLDNEVKPYLAQIEKFRHSISMEQQAKNWGESFRRRDAQETAIPLKAELGCVDVDDVAYWLARLPETKAS